MNRNVPVPFLGEEQRQRWLLTRLRAVVPPPYQAQGTHKGRVAVRKSRFFRINGVDSIPARCCTVLQRSDGYEYAFV